MTNRAEEYHFYKSIGICTRCHSRSAEPNKVLCMECADEDNERCRNKRQKNIEYERKKDLDKYYKLKADGICTYCKHRKAAFGKTKCDVCLALIRNRRNSKNNDIKRSERVAYGLCYVCGKHNVIPGKGVCEECYKVRKGSIEKIMYMPSNGFWKKDNKLIFKV